jgi:hypothetical protein
MRPAFCREAAIDHSPGLQPWVGRLSRCALKAAPEVGANRDSNPPYPNSPPRARLSVRIYYPRNPGLEPWAMVYSRFAAEFGRETPVART